MNIYYPQPQKVPDHFQPKQNLSFLPVIVYDTFRSVDNTRIIAICPPLYSIRKHLFPLKIFLEGKLVEHRVAIHPLQAIFEANYLIELDIPKTLRTKEKLIVEFHWKSCTRSCAIPMNPFSTKNTKLTLYTMQKEYPITWIKDWCLYYHRVHQVQHIIFYDNESEDFQNLIDGIAKINATLKFALISCVVWNFSFRLGQIGALNHCYRMVGCASNYYLNFDLDEYLINLSDQSLPQILESKTKEGILDLTIPGYWSRNILRKGFPPTSLPRITDLEYLLKEERLQCAPKTIFSCRGFTHIHVHYNQTLENHRHWSTAAKKLYTPVYLKLRIRQTVNYLISPDQPGWIRKTAWSLVNLVRICKKSIKSCKNLYRKKPGEQDSSSPAPPPSLYFNHHAVLSKNTDRNALRIDSEKHNSGAMEQDWALKKMLDQANLE